MSSLSGKVAVVTGGSSGIGRSVAITLARAGASVVIGSRNPETKAGGYDEGDGQPVHEYLQTEGARAEFFRTDVTIASEVAALADFATETFGALDIWINNAGAMPPPRPFGDYSEEDLDWLLSTNTKGTWHGIRAAASRMAKGNGGSIVNVLSSAAIRAHSNQSIYNMSKAAAAMATKCAALEFGKHAIRVNAVCPTLVKTSVTRGFIEAPGFSDWFKTVTTLGEPVEADQVAQAVLFLAGAGSHNVTGVMLPVDSGEGLGPPAAELPG